MDSEFKLVKGQEQIKKNSADAAVMIKVSPKQIFLKFASSMPTVSSSLPIWMSLHELKPWQLELGSQRQQKK